MCKEKHCSYFGIKSQKIFKYNVYLYITNLLYESVCDTIYSIVNGKVSLKRKYDLKYMPGFFSFLHTFGKNLKINPPLMLFFVKDY